MTDDEDFLRDTGRYRPELLAHCYRMLGSVHEAEDLVQETYLRAWRGFDGFEGRSSLRTWLYRIATTACLTALEQRNRRPLPTGLGAPSDDPMAPLEPASPEVRWLEPMPDALLAADPAGMVESRVGMRLALIAAFQHLPPKQRAVLILRDVLAWSASEVATLLGTTTASVNSALQRARARLATIAPAQDDVAEPTDPDVRELVDRYVVAFEDADIPAIEALLEQDAVWEMPPFPSWFVGSANIGRLIASHCPAAPGDTRMVRTAANGQPACAAYVCDETGVHRAYGLHVLSVVRSEHGPKIAHGVSFFDTTLFGAFGLPSVLPAATLVRP